MSINGKFPEQLIAMVSKDMKAAIVAESDRREISISQLVREKIEVADAVEAPVRIVLGADQIVEEVRGIDGTLIRSTVLNAGVRTADRAMATYAPPVRHEPDVGPETLAAYARNLAPDTEPDEVDGPLSDTAARVARLRARGLG